MKIVSFLPAATEILFALGLEDHLRGVTHECSYPPEAGDLPTVVTGLFDPEAWEQDQIDQQVRRRIDDGETLYEIDGERLRAIEPDLIVTQRLCDVCAPSGTEVSRVLKMMREEPDILWLTPNSIEDILENIRSVGKATGRDKQSRNLVENLRREAGELETVIGQETLRPEVFCLEWMDPPFRSGHWVPEQVRLAGGVDRLARTGEKSDRIEWDVLIEYDPDYLFVMPCGFDARETARRSGELEQFPELADLTAIRSNRTIAVDAEAYFSRPGPRVIQGARLLGHLLHPERVDWEGSTDAYRVLDLF